MACAVIPVATAGGAMVRAAGKAGDAVDAVADTAKAVDHVGDAVKGGASSVEGFVEWLNKGGMDNKVYFGVKGGDAQYTGITKQCIGARLTQHNKAGKGFDDLIIQFDNLTRNQARAIEQYFIENGPNKLNKINSIGQNNKYYNDAMNWAKSFLGK